MDQSGSSSQPNNQNEIFIPASTKNQIFRNEILIRFGDEEQHTPPSAHSINQNIQHVVNNTMIANDDRPLNNNKPIISWPFWLLGIAVLVAVIVAAVVFNNSPTVILSPQITTTTTWETTLTTTTETASALLSSSEQTSELWFTHTIETETVRTVNTDNILEPSPVLPSNYWPGEPTTFPVISQTTNEWRRCDSSPDNSFECTTSGCVATTSVCDGHPQCQDESDEWNCTQLDPKGTLQLRRNSTVHLMVCGDDWNTELANLVCSELGYFGGTNFTFTTDNKRSEGYTMYRVTEKDQLAFELIDSRTCNKGILQLQCEEYHCGRKINEDTLDQRYANRVISALTISPSLALFLSNNGAIKCAANIISPRWALTSYTCIGDKTVFDDKMKWKLIAGPYKISASEVPQQSVDIKRVVPYPQLNNKHSMYSHDVVLLELATPLHLKKGIGSVCLTETNSTIDPNERCLATGWKFDLKYPLIAEQYMTNVSAVNVQTGNSNSYNGELPDNTILVKPLSNTHTTCYNDTGAPLMCYVAGTGQWQLQGVLSNHSVCDNRPAIYNSITKDIATWIRHTVGNGRMFEQMNVTKKISTADYTKSTI